MADEFVALDIEADATVLTDAAVATLEDTWDGYEANDGDMEIVVLETIGDMAADLAADAAIMPSEALINYGIVLLGVEYDPGIPATGAITITVVDDAGYTIDAGFEIDIDGFAFQLSEFAIIPPGDTEVTGVGIIAVEPGTEYNGLAGSVVNAITSSVVVDGIALTSSPAGGTDQESRESFLNKVSKELQLRGRTLVTWRDYERFAEDFVTVERAIAIGNTAREVFVVLIGPDGLAVAAGVKTDVAALYAEFAQVNTVYTIGDANYWDITANVTVKAYPGYDLPDLENRVEAALEAYFAPLPWGTPKFGELGTRSTDTVIRANKVIDIIGDVEGVDYVVSLTLATLTTKAITGNAATDLIALTAHGLKAGYAVSFPDLTGGAGLTAGANYYVIASGLTDDAFKVSTTPGGSAVDFTTTITAGHVKPVRIADAGAFAAVGDLVMPGLVPLPTPGTWAVTAS